MFDFIIIGAGLTGCILAEQLAHTGKRVLIIEKKQHIGGTCYDYYNENGVLVHKYGPHILSLIHICNELALTKDLIKEGEVWKAEK